MNSSIRISCWGILLLVMGGCEPTHKVIHEASGAAASTGGGDGNVGGTMGVGGSGGGTGGTENPDGAGRSGNGTSGAVHSCSPMPVCGNGIAETNGPYPSCIETCDGTDLRGATCTSIGFRSGALSCNDCALDQSNCQSCAPLDEQLLSCGTNSQPGAPVAMAATDASIAVAFIRDGGLWIEMLAPDLSPLTEANRIASSNAADLDLIAAPSGWLLVARSESIDLYSLNASGGLLSTSVVTSGLAMPPLWLNGTTTRGIKVVPRSAGGVFVLWQTPDSDGSSHGLYAVALSANASAIAAPTRLETLGDPNFTATATPDGMLIAGRVMDVSGNRELVTFQVSASGALVGQPRSVDPFGDSPALAPTNDGGVVLAYQRFDPPATAQWVKLDATGEPQVGPIAVDPSELPIGATPISIVPMNADFVVVTPSGSGSVGNSFLRISEVGAVTAPLVPFLMDPRVAAVRAARCGSEIIVVSQSFDAGVLSFSFARVAP